MKIAIIGAGLSGAYLYSLLKKKDYKVSIFEKSRGAGGRCSTRYIDDKKIDHGTPFFEVSDKKFEAFCDEKVQQNVLIKYQNKYYPTNGLNKLCSDMINPSDLSINTKIVSCEYIDHKWNLQDENGNSYDGFDKLCMTIPTPQILEMNIQLPKSFINKLQSVRYDSIATLIAYNNTHQDDIDGALLENNEVFKKIVNNSLKYHHENFSSYVFHLNAHITNEQNFSTKEEVEKFMIEKINKISHTKIQDTFTLAPHFWKYAFVSHSLKEECLFDEKNALFFCGDYFGGQNLQSAFLSANALDDMII